MLKIPGMLMIGAPGRNAGKTEFVCSLIKKYGKEQNIIAVKVTTINNLNSGCPRGGDGCGACSALKGNFCITEEKDKHAGKDTCRMLAAGAARVFWLKALKTHLKEGINALLEIIGNDGIMICESNSLRSVVEPGLFIMIGNGAGGCKPSAGHVIGYADYITRFDGSRFDIDLDKIKPAGGRWAFEMDAAAVILAGGKSRRMGADKSMLSVEGKPMIQYILEQLRPHFRQMLISSGDVSKYASLGVKVIPDEVAGKGPLMGIASALRASANQTNFVIACDIPNISIGFIRGMLKASEGYDAVVPQTGPGRYEPLFAVYKKSALPAIDRALAAGIYRVTGPLKECKVRYINMADAGPLKNLNTMDDYSEFTGRKKNAAV